ncbi:MAG: histidine triad nucleotide-binding protein [Candidatus Margulisbacteria bacterium]|nr:histidine triad nucleotide-binding protein [Candidatus Margulisiibacteriota bacterium]
MDCIFCKIISRQIPASIIYEDDKVLAFNDISPKAPVHVLVIPKTHVDTVDELADMSVVADLFLVMKKIAAEQGIDKSGYRIVVNQGHDAGQAVPHLHFHLLGGRSLLGLSIF